jgi:hypothetical protein
MDKINVIVESEVKRDSNVGMRLIGEGIISEFKRKGYELKDIDDLEGCADYLYNAVEQDSSYTLEQYAIDTINNCPEILKKIK